MSTPSSHLTFSAGRAWCWRFGQNVVLTVLLVVSLGVNATWLQAAADPPIRVFVASADDAGGGGSFVDGDLPILTEYTLESPLTLVSVNTSHLSRNHDHTCLVTASAQVHHPTNPSSGIVILGLSMGRDRRIHPPTERWVHLYKFIPQLTAA